MEGRTMQGNRQSFSRADRVRKALMREVSDILMTEMKEPRLSDIMISVTDVEVTHDLSFARIYVSVMGSEEIQTEVMDILAEAKPRIRFEIGQRIRLRHTPDIDIRLDNSLERGARVTQLLDKISRGEDV
jgi:ribosome-binding factor A